MRYFIATFLTVFSLTTFATTTLRLESEGYNVEAALTPDQPGALTGAVAMKGHITSEMCSGRYRLDMDAGKLTIDLDGRNGPGTTGGCSNESMIVNISHGGYMELKQGNEVEVTYMSQYFYMQVRVGRVKVVGQTN